MTMRYYIRLPDPSLARGDDPDLSFHSQGEGFAEELQQALREDALFLRWQAKQEPDGRRSRAGRHRSGGPGQRPAGRPARRPR